MKKWNKRTDIEEYENTLSDLVNFGCLIEKMPKVNELIVDLDNILSQDKRGTQSWNFHRISQLEKILETTNIDKVTYIASQKFNNKIDDEAKANKWRERVNIEIVKNGQSKIHPAISMANERRCYYLGNRLIPKDKNHKEMRIKSRQIRFKINNKVLSILDLDPFYEWRMENLLEAMYKEYY